MKRGFAFATILAVAGLALAGCGGGEAKWSGEAASYAAYATQIPLYPGTKMVDAMGSESWGDSPDTYSYGMTWWCEARASRADLIAWYEAKLPGARRSTPYEDVVQLSVTPEGAKPGEEMGVLFEEDGKYRVFETRKNKELHAS